MLYESLHAQSSQVCSPSTSDPGVTATTLTNTHLLLADLWWVGLINATATVIVIFAKNTLIVVSARYTVVIISILQGKALKLTVRSKQLRLF